MLFGRWVAVGMLGAMGLASYAASIKKQPFGKTQAGKQVELYTLTNSKGVEAAITNYGGIIVSLKVPDRAGKLSDVVLGFVSLEGYLKNAPYLGAVIGRYGNRIGKARFTLNSVEYKLPKNDGENTLHGGPKGFDKVLWTAKEVPNGVELTDLSKDGEEGFPGNLSVTVVYTLSDDNELKIDQQRSPHHLVPGVGGPGSWRAGLPGLTGFCRSRLIIPAIPHIFQQLPIPGQISLDAPGIQAGIFLEPKICRIT